MLDCSGIDQCSMLTRAFDLTSLLQLHNLPLHSDPSPSLTRSAPLLLRPGFGAMPLIDWRWLAWGLGTSEVFPLCNCHDQKKNREKKEKQHPVVCGTSVCGYSSCKSFGGRGHCLGRCLLQHLMGFSSSIALHLAPSSFPSALICLHVSHKFPFCLHLIRKPFSTCLLWPLSSQC